MSRGTWTCLGTTDISPPVINNTDRMNKMVSKKFLPGWSPCDGGSQTDVGTTDISQSVKNNRQNEPAGQVDVISRVEVHVTGDLKHVKGTQMSHDLSKQNTYRMVS